MSSTRTSSRTTLSKGDKATYGGFALFAVLCCAAIPIALTVGLGAAFSFLATPMVLIPTLLAVVGIFVWYLKS